MKEDVIYRRHETLEQSQSTQSKLSIVSEIWNGTLDRGMDDDSKTKLDESR